MMIGNWYDMMWCGLIVWVWYNEWLSSDRWW